MLPLLVKREGIAQAEAASRAAVERARATLDVLRRMRAIRPASVAQTEEVQRQEREATDKLAKREDAHATAASELAGVDEQISQKDAQLRQRFGVDKLL